MDAQRAREQLRRRFHFSLDAEASLDRGGDAGPGEALCRARPEPPEEPGRETPGTAGLARRPRPCPARTGRVSFPEACHVVLQVGYLVPGKGLRDAVALRTCASLFPGMLS